MNENNEGTPNPLNPNPAPAADSTPEPQAGALKPAALETEPVTKVPSEGVVEIETAHEAAMNPSTDPSNRPMEQAPTGVAEAPKKKKTGLIVGILIALLIATACGVTAVLLMNNNSGGDAVVKAMNKLMSGDVPSNVAVSGTISVKPNTTSSITNMKIDLKSEMVSGSMINSTVANLTVEGKNNKSLSVELDEMYGTDGDLFLKVDGIGEAIKNPSLIEALFNSDSTPVEVDCDTLSAGEEVDCEVESTLETDCEDATDCTEVVIEEVTDEMSEDELAEYSALAEMFDGKWFRISTEELTSMSGSESGSELTCVVDLIKSTNSSSNSLAESYNKNPFIYSSDENITVMRKANPIYEVGINTENFTNFADAMSKSELASKINDCLGSKQTFVDTDELAEAVKQLPALYVEVDSNYNFTRLYFTKDINDGAATVTVDLDFSYPANVNISEPTEYEDLSSLMENMFNSTYDSTGTEIEILPTE